MEVVVASSTTTMPRSQRYPPRKVNTDERRHIRWNVLWSLIFCFVLIPLPLWFGLVTSCQAWRWLVNIPALLSLSVLIFVFLQSLYTTSRLYRTVNNDHSWMFSPATATTVVTVTAADVEAEGATLRNHEPTSTHPYHVVCMCSYKEPLSLLMKTLDSLTQQTVPDHLIVVVALESATPDLDAKTNAIKARYHHSFAALYITVHPRAAFPGEIPGKCSNQNYAMRSVIQALKASGQFNLDLMTGTTCDSDTVFPKRYFEFLGADFLSLPVPRRHEVCWQAPLFYHIALDQRPWFVRITAVLRQVFMMGLLIPLSINTMSVYSFSLTLYIAGNYTHYRYQMDDIIYTLNAMTATHKRVSIRLIPLPVLSGPTSGSNLTLELQEWFRQARRWTIGASEVFHYYFTKLIFSHAFGWVSGISYGLVFLLYYGYVLCASALFGLAAVAAQVMGLSQCTASTAPTGAEHLWSKAPLYALLASCVLLFFCMVLDRVTTSKVLHIKESGTFLHLIVDSLLAYPTLVAYSCVEYAALLEVCIRGKSVCTHKPSRKEDLATAAAGGSSHGPLDDAVGADAGGGRLAAKLPAAVAGSEHACVGAGTAGRLAAGGKQSSMEIAMIASGLTTYESCSDLSFASSLSASAGELYQPQCWHRHMADAASPLSESDDEDGAGSYGAAGEGATAAMTPASWTGGRDTGNTRDTGEGHPGGTPGEMA